MAVVSNFYINYIRRFRLEIDVTKRRLPPPLLPDEYEWVPWSAGLAERHAAVKYASFRSEIDSHVFPSLGEAAGCRRLMNQISEHESFLPQATWLIAHSAGIPGRPMRQDCATIQGISKSHGVGSIQNVGVTPNHRGCGLGRALVLQALRGFRRAGLRTVCLEVTADNGPAVALYKSLGFRLTRTMYQEVELEPAFDG